MRDGRGDRDDARLFAAETRFHLLELLHGNSHAKMLPAEAGGQKEKRREVAIAAFAKEASSMILFVLVRAAGGIARLLALSRGRILRRRLDAVRRGDDRVLALLNALLARLRTIRCRRCGRRGALFNLRDGALRRRGTFWNIVDRGLVERLLLLAEIIFRLNPVVAAGLPVVLRLRPFGRSASDRRRDALRLVANKRRAGRRIVVRRRSHVLRRRHQRIGVAIIKITCALAVAVAGRFRRLRPGG